jgi:altronate dehydratase large subunit
MTKTLLRLHPRDNVAVATAELRSGEEVLLDGAAIAPVDEIPFGHKVAIRAIARGQTVVKYGSPIGDAVTDIPAGSHVHIHNCRSARGRDERGAGRPTEAEPPRTIERATPAPSPDALSSLTGYRRTDGRFGVRNHVLVLPTVQCANGVVERISRTIPDVVALPHDLGCSQIGADLEQTTRVLEAFAGHPNVGAVLLVSLGCETLSAPDLAKRLSARGQSVELITIQDVGGTEAAYERGLAIARRMLEETARMKREPMAALDLVIGVECGGSDAWSGVTANPAVGAASDLVVTAGGTVVLSEVTEFIGAERALAARAATPEVAKELLRVVSEREEAVRAGRKSAGGKAPASPEDLAPGNVEGGLTTIDEKSLGAIAKGGTTPVREVVAYGCAPTESGLVVMDTAGNDPESVTGMVAGGAQVVLFTTGRGSPTGCPIAPTIKVATNTPMFDALRGDMDLNAGTVLEGETLEAAGTRIVEELASVARGSLTAAERGRHGVFAVERLGPKV